MVGRRRFLKFCVAAAACGVGGASYVFGLEPVWLRTVRCEIPLAGLDPALDGFTIAQLSDLHHGAGVPLSLFEQAVARANDARPDIVALTGDFVHRGGGTGLEREIADILTGLQPRIGTYAVLGNHDAGVYRPGGGREAIRRAQVVSGALGSRGIAVLRNEVVTPVPGLRLAGLGDLWTGDFEPDRIHLDATTVVLSHNPDTAPELAERGAGLILSGHTHGGQVSIPFLGPPILPVRLRQYHAGHYRLGEGQLYVNRGVGWLRRVRLFVRPEVTILTLRSAPVTT